jgi:hypothetical protein
MNTEFKRKHSRGWRNAVAAAALASIGMGTALADEDEGHMTLRSLTFANGGTLPLSMINNSPDANGLNTCTASGAPGGNQSPQLTWKHAPDETRSFIVIIYDVTAQFTHWAMYCTGAVTALPHRRAWQRWRDRHRLHRRQHEMPRTATCATEMGRYANSMSQASAFRTARARCHLRSKTTIRSLTGFSNANNVN